MVVVVGTHLLHQLVVGAVEGDEDTDDFEGFGAEPGHMALGLLLGAALGWVVSAQRRPGALLHLLVLHTAIEELGLFGLQRGLLLLLLVVLVVVLLVRLDLELHGLGRRDKTYGNVTLTGGIVSEVYAERPVAVIDYFAGDEKVELDGLDVGMEVPPAKHLLELAGLDDGPPFGPGARVTGR